MVLKEKYYEFYDEYKRIINEETTAKYIVDENGEQKRLPITYENVKAQISQFKVSDRKWTDEDI